VRKKNFPSEAQLVWLQRLAAASIGTREPRRLYGLTLEQSLLIKELQLIQAHLERLEHEIGLLVEQSREGQILTSIAPIGPIFAATITATVGNIANFLRLSQLKSYFGWASRREQTGISLIGPTWAGEDHAK
jgi:transposase